MDDNKPDLATLREELKAAEATELQSKVQAASTEINVVLDKYGLVWDVIVTWHAGQMQTILQLIPRG